MSATLAPAPRWTECTALFGGTFDPPHLGHREAVRGLFTLPAVAAVRILPAAIPPQKRAFSESAHRVAMTRLAFSATLQNRFPPEVTIDTCEIDRAARTGQPSYAYDTVMALKKDFPRLAFVIGADQLERLPTWYRFTDLLESCHWIVLERKPNGMASAQASIKEWKASGLIHANQTGINQFGLNGRAEEGVFRLRGAKSFLKVVPTEARALSSSEIRRQLALTGQAAPDQMLPEVEAYLMQNQLYGSASALVTQN